MNLGDACFFGVLADTAPTAFELVGYGTAIIPLGTEGGYDTDVLFSSGTMLDTVQDGDCCRVVRCSDAGSMPSYPEDFTPIYETGTTLPSASVSYKFLTSSDDRFTVGKDDTYDQPIVWWIVRGINATTPNDATRTVATVSDGQPNPPSITPATAYTWCESIIVIDDEDLAAGYTVTPPSGFTMIGKEDSGNGFETSGGATIFAAYRILTTTDPEDPAAWTYSGLDDAAAITVLSRWWEN